MTLRRRVAIVVASIVVPILLALGALAAEGRARRIESAREHVSSAPWAGRGGPGAAGRPSPAIVLLVPTVFVTLVILVTLGPVVARLRRLTAHVRELPKSGYRAEVPVDDTRDEIGELSRAFAHMTTVLRRELEHRERREHVLREFVANTSHDLAIPLSVLTLRLSELEAIARTMNAPVQPEVLATLHASGAELAYLTGLLRNLTVAARLDDPDTERVVEPVDLRALVERVASRARVLAQQRDIVLEDAVPAEAPVVLGDVTMLEQCVANLAHNAVRHHPAGGESLPRGHVAIVLETDHSSEGRRFVLRVIDDGVGLSEELQAALEAQHDDARGRGRGLRIARRVAERHGMELHLSNRAEGGTEARLSGPIETAPKA
ncbi:MAG: HAMP domain-containing sensor histidine kinase [Sandaracinus sp.]